MLVTRWCKEGRAVLSRQFNHVSRFCEGVRKRTVDEVRQACFEIRFMEDMIPWVVIVATGDHAVYLPHHIVKIFDDFATVRFSNRFRLFVFNIPTVGDPHPRKRCIFLAGARVDMGCPQRHVRIGVYIQKSDTERFSVRSLHNYILF